MKRVKWMTQMICESFGIRDTMVEVILFVIF